ncbi:hypothetical protein J5N97_028221 [Dioscorea zingiberensis]|uniref:Uncharacterized protein n=1 Tax=Dioscorea zingiberensis TaxID=325984 RepID=A0A9D5BYP9_9LILI|nr:hypothetical protein J5N97_028221 [Dioscorea zingiberensis]
MSCPVAKVIVGAPRFRKEKRGGTLRCRLAGEVLVVLDRDQESPESVGKPPYRRGAWSFVGADMSRLIGLRSEGTY